ncbi:MAPEG family protein [Shewanella litoralis]|uniref:Glutathione S-transferase n=1 Tax=Shewanella litoralis TaxID=2282700 RepID=A0ABQ2QXN2_9GAMM|nr:MAPEG family protein [Shewanella litoralis]GGQ03314.1 glutathione S-transferase [Shewanella litoralis]
MTLMISGLYAGLTALLLLGLAYKVVKLRRFNKIGIGDGGNQELSLAIRAHGNLVENAPVVMVLLVLAELNGMPDYLLHIVGTVWIVARLLHAIGLNQGKGGLHFGRFWGVLMTWLVLLSLAVANIGFFLGL